MDRYDPLKIEQKWQKIWDETEAFKADPIDESKPKKYVAEMFPYPSGAGLHVGHVRNFTIVDVLTRFYTQQEMNVLRPFGYDTFGLPAENYAIKTGISPQNATETNIKNFRKQAKKLGYAVDWSREINTSDPEYYKWTQWCFLKLYKAGLAYQKESYQWWCPEDKTVLANEQVENGKCWRCGHEVEKKKMKQWFFKITDYADELLDGIDALDWPDKIKTMQKNWIGRSEGAEVKFEIEGGPRFVGEPPRAGKKNTKRRTIQAFVYDPKTDKYLAISYKKMTSIAPVIGGIDGNETPEVTARREVLEETGYKNLRLIDILGQYHAVFYAEHKDVNRDIEATQVYFELENDERDEISEAEKATQDTLWLTHDELLHADKNMHNEISLGFSRILQLASNNANIPVDSVLRKQLELEHISKNPSSENAKEDENAKSSAREGVAASRDYCVAEPGQNHGPQGSILRGSPNPESSDTSQSISLDSITVFTTRPDTIFGATFLVLAPEHPMVKYLVNDETRQKVDQYRTESLKKSEIERQENKEKTGVFTGSYAINPATGAKMPIWIADYVLMGYGTGAIMAVPAHDERDFEFAEKFDLPIIEVVEKPENSDDAERCYHGEGQLVNSGKFNGKNSSDVREEIVQWLEDMGVGKTKVTYRMRDWLISRQRYWGCPIPVAYDKDGNVHPISEDQLPVMHPEVKDYQPDDSGRSPLAKAEDWLKVTLKDENGNDIECTRETDTLDGYACSSWYLWRYTSPHDNVAAWDPEAIKYWAPTDVYVGGDHAVAHLLYIRFWCKFFADQGYLPFREPVKKLLYNGYINAPDGKKMSKSKGNVIDPLEVIESGYGADTLRTYEMFIGPYDQDAAWNTEAIGGVYRFLNRCWTLCHEVSDVLATNEQERARLARRHKVIKKVTEDLHRQSFNTAVAALMEYVNELYKQKATTEDVIILAKLLKPFAPHLASEMLELLGSNDIWPTWDEKYLQTDEVEMVVQVNGKLRAKLMVKTDILGDDEQLKTLALADENVQKYTDGKEIRKVIVPKGAKLINIVV